MARAKAKTPVVVPEPPPIRPQLRQMMDFLSKCYSPGQLQLRLLEHLDKLPHDMPKAERLLRIEALKELGYVDFRKAIIYDEE